MKTQWWTRTAALAAPVFMLAYAVMRVIDGLDGERGPGPAWNIGHTLFLISFLCFAVLLVGLRRLAVRGGVRPRFLVESFLGAGMLGVAAFLWVIAGDLFPAFAYPLGPAVQVAGPLLFVVGSAGLLAQLAAPRLGRVPLWSPVLVLVGFVVITVDLDLLPLGACLFLAALAPLAYHRRGPVGTRATRA